jgi:hypothetical protein
VGSSSLTDPELPRKTKKIRCKTPGCPGRRVVDISSNAKYCRRCKVARDRTWGLANIRACKFAVGPKKKCGVLFVPIHRGDFCCDDHALPFDTKHRVGECPVCYDVRQLYQGVGPCSTCMRALPAGDERPAQNAVANEPTPEPEPEPTPMTPEEKLEHGVSTWRPTTARWGDDMLQNELKKVQANGGPTKPRHFATLEEAEKRGIKT